MLQALLHTGLWAIAATSSLLWWGTPIPGVLVAALLTPLLTASRHKRWLWAPASLVGPVVALLLFSASVATAPTLLPLPELTDPAQATSAALDTLTLGIVVAGLVAPPIEALVQRSVLDSPTPRGLLMDLMRGNYLAIGAALLVVLGLWQLPLEQLERWSGTMSPAKVATVLVASLVGGIRGGWAERILRSLDRSV